MIKMRDRETIVNWFRYNSNRIQYLKIQDQFLVRCKQDQFVIGRGYTIQEALDQTMSYYGESK